MKRYDLTLREVKNCDGYYEEVPYIIEDECGELVKYSDVEELIDTLQEYLKFLSCDGRKERMPLRNKLKEMINELSTT